MQKALRFFQLRNEHRLVLLAAAIALPVLALGLRVMGLSRVQALTMRSKPRASNVAESAEPRLLASLVKTASRHTIGRSTCLTRSLCLVWLLQRRGVPNALRIGVQLSDGQLAAHAWVEVDGVPVNDDPEIGARFHPFGDLVPLRAFKTLGSL